MHFVFETIFYKIYIKKKNSPKTNARRTSLVNYFFVQLLLASGGITMDFEWGGQAFHGSSSPTCSGMGAVGYSRF